jgi:hypothetical protein
VFAGACSAAFLSLKRQHASSLPQSIDVLLDNNNLWIKEVEELEVVKTEHGDPVLQVQSTQGPHGTDGDEVLRCEQGCRRATAQHQGAHSPLS